MHPLFTPLRMRVRLAAFITFGLCIFSAPCVFAQEKNVFLHPDKFYKKFFPKLKGKRDLNTPDSSYIRSYPNYLSVGMHILSPAIRINIKPRNTSASDSDRSLKLQTN